ncbi:MAG: META domain-containing protein [Prevotella sp.]|jgi:hypothetical protein|nr:META domain-containing protein [Prevotella sp.]
MKTQLFILTALFILTTGMVGCDKEEGKEAPNPLTGTKWKLVGFANVETGDIIEAEPKDCEECYTITFDSDSTASGISIVNIIMVNLSIPYIGVTTMAYDEEIGNVALFYEAIQQIEAYSHEKEELKFYYNNKKNYLIYKLREQ